MNALMLSMPNIPCDATPVRQGREREPERRRWGTPRDFAAEGFEAKPHWIWEPTSNILDFERGNKLSGSRFTVLGGAGARLERALINFFIRISTPAAVSRSGGRLSSSSADHVRHGPAAQVRGRPYHVTGGVYLIPTAEVRSPTCTPGEVLDAARCRCTTPPSPPASARRPVRRSRHPRHHPQHEFDKVEMVKFATPESDDELETMTAEAEYLLQQLGCRIA